MTDPGSEYVMVGGMSTFAMPKTFPSEVGIGDAKVTLHAGGRITGATAAEWSAALTQMEGYGHAGFQVMAWLILRELQRQEAQ